MVATEYDISAAFDAVERELINSMMRNLKHHRAQEEAEGLNWSMWQAEQLKGLERYRKQNQKKFKKKFSVLNQNIEELIRQAREMGGMEQEQEILEAIKNGFKGFRKAGSVMQAAFFRTNSRKLDALIKATTADMKKAETAVLRMASDQYRKIIYNAQIYANTGAGTYEQAVDMAAKDFLSRGLNCIQYANGARHTISDYADMALRTASKRAYLAGEGEKRQEWGISTVIINKRGNPCPRCLPFVGKVFIDDVWSGGKKKDGPYPLLSSAIAAGLYHPRCKDSHTTYFPGISTPPEKLSRSDVKATEADYWKDQKKQYVKRQAARFERMAEGSLDPENRKRYAEKAQRWKGLAAGGDGAITPITPPKFVGRVDVSDAVLVESKLAQFRDSVIHDAAESAYVILENGKTYRFTGGKNRVYPDALGIALKGAIMTHNHPITETGFSFSRDDFDFFQQHGLAELRGFDEKYEYVLRRGGKSPEIEKAGLLDMTKEQFYHQVMYELAERNGIYYERIARGAAGRRK